MTSERNILRSEHGVTLTEVALRSGDAIAAVAYVVRSGRTPEAPNFANVALAEAAFCEEVARCIELGR